MSRKYKCLCFYYNFLWLKMFPYTFISTFHVSDGNNPSSTDFKFFWQRIAPELWRFFVITSNVYQSEAGLRFASLRFSFSDFR